MANHSVIPLVKQLQAALRSALDEALAPAGLSAPELAVLASLQRQSGLSGADLARAAMVTPQSMTPILKSLETRKLIERRPHPGGGRSMPTRLTAEGSDLLVLAGEGVRGVEERMLSEISENDRAWLAVMLQCCLSGLAD